MVGKGMIKGNTIIEFKNISGIPGLQSYSKKYAARKS
jgi:hypothetical protein